MKHFFAIVAISSALSTTAYAEIVDNWQTQEGDTGGYAIVTIAPCDSDTGKICGTITDIIDNENRESVGKPIIIDMESHGKGKYRGGRIYAPDRDQWYNARMVLKGDTLEVYGCVAGGLICRGQDWSRVE